MSPKESQRSNKLWEEFVLDYVGSKARNITSENSEVADSIAAAEVTANATLMGLIMDSGPGFNGTDDKVILDHSYLEKFLAELHGERVAREKPTTQEREEWVALRACLCDALLGGNDALAECIRQLLASEVPPSPEDPVVVEALGALGERVTWKNAIARTITRVYHNIARAREGHSDLGSEWWGDLDPTDRDGIINAVRLQALGQVEIWVANVVSRLNFAGKMIDILGDIWQDRGEFWRNPSQDVQTARGGDF